MIRRPTSRLGRLRSAVITAGAALSLAATAAAPAAEAAQCAYADRNISAMSVAQSRSAVRCLLNAERSDVRRPPLRVEFNLREAATEHAVDMARKQFFSHTGADGDSAVDRARDAGYIPADRRWVVRENLGWAYERQSSPRELVEAWMHSTSHRRNILARDVKQIGVGISRDAPIEDVDGITAVTVFGARW